MRRFQLDAPRCPVHSFHRDGAMRVDGNFGSTRGYEPNSIGERQEQAERTEPPLDLAGAAGHWDYRQDDEDYYTQPGELFLLMTPEQQQQLFENAARSVGAADVEAQKRHIGNCMKADPAYVEGVAKALNIPISGLTG